MKRESSAYLRDILVSISRIKSYTEDLSKEEYEKKQLIVDGTLRNLEIIGEAVSQLPAEFKERYPQVPWQDIKNFRNVVAHHYFMLNADRIWDIITNRLDSLEKQVKGILKEL